METRPKHALIFHPGAPRQLSRNSFGIVVFFPFSSQPGLCLESPISPIITARQEMVLGKSSVLATRSRVARAAFPDISESNLSGLIIYLKPVELRVSSPDLQSAHPFHRLPRKWAKISRYSARVICFSHARRSFLIRHMTIKPESV